MKIKRVCLNTVKFSISSSLWLSLVEVRLGSSFAVQLLDFICVHVEKIAMVRLLVRSREAAENYHVVLRDLEKATALETNPVRVFFDFEVKSLPVVALFQVELLDQVSSLATVEPCNHVKSFIVKSKGGVEVSSGVQICNLGPSI